MYTYMYSQFRAETANLRLLQPRLPVGRTLERSRSLDHRSVHALVNLNVTESLREKTYKLHCVADAKVD